MSIFDTLIYNRTQADRDALDALLSKAKEGTLSDSEWAEFSLGQHRGAYNHTDLNRVITAQDELWKRLSDYGYAVPGYIPVEAAAGRKYWIFSDTPTPTQLERYRNNVAALQDALPVYDTTPRAPVDMVGLTIQEANAIEKILVDVDAVIRSLEQIFLRSGQALVYSGFGLYARGKEPAPQSGAYVLEETLYTDETASTDGGVLILSLGSVSGETLEL